MNNYIFLSADGRTFDANFYETKQLQIIGVQSGVTPHIAYKKLISRQIEKRYLYEFKSVVAINFDGQLHLLSKLPGID